MQLDVEIRRKTRAFTFKWKCWQLWTAPESENFDPWYSEGVKILIPENSLDLKDLQKLLNLQNVRLDIGNQTFF